MINWLKIIFFTLMFNMSLSWREYFNLPEIKGALWAVELRLICFLVEYSNINPYVLLVKVTVLIWLLLCDRWGLCNKQELLFMEMTSRAISKMWAWADSHQNNFIFWFRVNNNVFCLPPRKTWTWSVIAGSMQTSCIIRLVYCWWLCISSSL